MCLNIDPSSSTRATSPQPRLRSPSPSRGGTGRPGPGPAAAAPARVPSWEPNARLGLHQSPEFGFTCSPAHLLIEALARLYFSHTRSYTNALVNVSSENHKCWCSSLPSRPCLRRRSRFFFPMADWGRTHLGPAAVPAPVPLGFLTFSFLLSSLSWRLCLGVICSPPVSARAGGIQLPPCISLLLSPQPLPISLLGALPFLTDRLLLRCLKLFLESCHFLMSSNFYLPPFLCV